MNKRDLSHAKAIYYNYRNRMPYMRSVDCWAVAKAEVEVEWVDEETTVRVRATEDDCPDLSFLDDETRKRLENGELWAFGVITETKCPSCGEWHADLERCLWGIVDSVYEEPSNDESPGFYGTKFWRYGVYAGVL